MGRAYISSLLDITKILKKEYYQDGLLDLIMNDNKKKEFYENCKPIMKSNIILKNNISRNLQDTTSSNPLYSNNNKKQFIKK